MADESDIKPEAAGAANRLRGYRVLVVDDEEDARAYLVAVVEDAGAEVFEAADGDQGLAIARARKPDLITLDLSMPGRDGVEAFVDLRSSVETAEIPVCIVTGHPEFRKVLYDRPVPRPEGYLDKPVAEETLLSTLSRILHLREKKDARSRRGTEPPR